MFTDKFIYHNINIDIELTCFGYAGIDAIKESLKIGEACSVKYELTPEEKEELEKSKQTNINDIIIKVNNNNEKNNNNNNNHNKNKLIYII